MNNLFEGAKSGDKFLCRDGGKATFIEIVHSDDFAKEQHKIDVDKACEWLKNNTPIGLMEDEIPDFLEDFKKAMEE